MNYKYRTKNEPTITTIISVVIAYKADDIAMTTVLSVVISQKTVIILISFLHWFTPYGSREKRTDIYIFKNIALIFVNFQMVRGSEASTIYYQAKESAFVHHLFQVRDIFLKRRLVRKTNFCKIYISSSRPDSMT